MAVDINNELKKSTEKTNVYKTYSEYKKDYNELKKKSGDSQELNNKKLKQPIDKFVKGRKKHTTTRPENKSNICRIASTDFFSAKDDVLGTRDPFPVARN